MFEDTALREEANVDVDVTVRALHHGRLQPRSRLWLWTVTHAHAHSRDHRDKILPAPTWKLTSSCSSLRLLQCQAVSQYQSSYLQLRAIRFEVF